MPECMTSMNRVLEALSHREPDRVPLFLLLSLYGAKELGMGVKKYFSDPANVVRAQMAMREKYKNDCYYAFFYAAVETEALGGEVVYTDEGPPNAGEPLIKTAADIKKLEFPEIKDCSSLVKVLDAISGLKKEAGNDVPIIGVVMSPFSVPVIQMGFERYLDIMHEDRDSFDLLMKKNEEFCARWANAQLCAGATAICYFDPVSSPTIIPQALYKSTGCGVGMRTAANIKGPSAIHLASGRTLDIIDDIINTGFLAVGVSELDDISELKEKCRGRIAMLGNLNGIKISRSSVGEVETMVKELIMKAASGGGFILSDNHGEIPYQVPEENLLAISAAIDGYGRYPITND